MSGHSKWATIHRQKEVVDRKRGQLFSKFARAIAIAARDGADPEGNFKLRLAIEKAKLANLPKENIQRALSKAGGKVAGEGLEEVILEGYGPEGIAVMVEAVTDNKNRTTAEVKSLFERGGGKLTQRGAVSFQFKKTGLLTVKKSASPEEQILKIIDLGVEDVEEASDAIEVYTKPGQLEMTKKELEARGLEVLDFELVMQPTLMVPINSRETAQKILDFMERLEDQADVHRVFANFDIPNELMGQTIKPRHDSG